MNVGHRIDSHTDRTHGFTLLELMVAILLGSMVVYVAVAGLRTASQSVTAANRLALENSILRTGVVIALENTDFWLALDDGTPGQPLRGLASDGSRQRGLPFTPLRDSQPFTNYGALTPSGTPPTIPADASLVVQRGLDEFAGGWDPNAWSAAEARGWSWGNLAERTPLSSGLNPAKLKTFGRYEIIASTDKATSSHHWQQRQLDGLNRSLGYYGLFDYLPANTGLMISEKLTTGSFTGTWVSSAEWCNPNGGPYYRMASDGNLTFTLDRLADTWGQVFSLPNRQVATANRSRLASRRYSTGIAIGMEANNRSVSDIAELLTNSELVDPVLHDSGPGGLANKPTPWPSLTVNNLRFIRTGAFINLNRIAWMNPLTGQGTELSFTCFGTTLRGARQQRLRDEAGWADPFPAAGAPKANLDTY